MLILKQSTMFSGQSLRLAYGLHFRFQHALVIRKLVKACMEGSSEPEVQLADVVARFVDKKSELIELAETEYKSTSHGTGANSGS